MKHNSQNISSKVQTVESISKAYNQFDKDKQLFVGQVQRADRSLTLNEFKANEVAKVDITHADMNSGTIAAFTTTTKSSDRVSIVDKHVLVRAHKSTGKDIWSNKRQLRALEDGRKGRDVALTERRVGGQNMNDEYIKYYFMECTRLRRQKLS